MIDEGVFVRDGIASFPSISAYGFYPFITGEDAAKSGIYGIHWLDRSREEGVVRNYIGRTHPRLNGDLRPEVATIFERFGAQHSFTANSYCNRGAHASYSTGWGYTMATYRGDWWVPRALAAVPLIGDRLAPDWPAVEHSVIDAAIADLHSAPKIQWITLVSADAHAHHHGLEKRYPELLRGLDAEIGRYREASDRLGLERERIYAVVSDHGIEEVHASVDLTRVLAAHGLRAFQPESTKLLDDELTGALDEVAGFDAVVAINGDLMAHVYVRDPDRVGIAGWRERPPRAALERVIDALSSEESVELVISRGEGGAVEVRGKGGEGTITRTERGYAYRVTGIDPLGYADDSAIAPLVGTGDHEPPKWLASTHRSAYPYAIVRLHRLMAEENAGDLVITSAEGWDFSLDYELFVERFSGGHGGLRAAQMRVPYVLTGPRVPQGVTIETAAAEDLGATLLDLLDQTSGGAGVSLARAWAAR
jgi:hypothetical protein